MRWLAAVLFAGFAGLTAATVLLPVLPDGSIMSTASEADTASVPMTGSHADQAVVEDASFHFPASASIPEAAGARILDELPPIIKTGSACSAAGCLTVDPDTGYSGPCPCTCGCD